MTVSAPITDDVFVRYTGTGVVTDYPLPGGEFFAATDFVVSVNGVVYQSGYSIIDKSGDTNLDHVRFDTAPLSGQIILIARQVPIEQATNYTAYDAFPADSHEAALDYLTLVCQDQQAQIDQSLKINPADWDLASPPQLPLYEAGKILIWDDTFARLENSEFALAEYEGNAAASAAAAAVSETNAATSAQAAATSETNAAAADANASSSAGAAAQSAIDAQQAAIAAGHVAPIIHTGRSLYTFEPIGSVVGGSGAFAGGVLAANGKLYAIPYNKTQWSECDPVTLTSSLVGSAPGSGAYIGGVVAPNGHIYVAPYNAPTFAKFNPDTAVTTTFGTSPTAGAYAGVVLLPNGKVICMPHNATQWAEIDTSNDTVRFFGTAPGGGAYMGGVYYPDRYIYCVPWNATNFDVFNVVTETVQSSVAVTNPVAGNFCGGFLFTRKASAEGIPGAEEGKGGEIIYLPYNNGAPGQFWVEVTTSNVTPQYRYMFQIGSVGTHDNSCRGGRKRVDPFSAQTSARVGWYAPADWDSTFWQGQLDYYDGFIDYISHSDEQSVSLVDVTSGTELFWDVVLSADGDGARGFFVPHNYDKWCVGTPMNYVYTPSPGSVYTTALYNHF
jgi:hypothetical protein